MLGAPLARGAGSGKIFARFSDGSLELVALAGVGVDFARIIGIARCATHAPTRSAVRRAPCHGRTAFAAKKNGHDPTSLEARADEKFIRVEPRLSSQVYLFA